MVGMFVWSFSFWIMIVSRFDRRICRFPAPLTSGKRTIEQVWSWSILSTRGPQQYDLIFQATKRKKPKLNFGLTVATSLQVDYIQSWQTFAWLKLMMKACATVLLLTLWKNARRELRNSSCCQKSHLKRKQIRDSDCRWERRKGLPLTLSSRDMQRLTILFQFFKDVGNGRTGIRGQLPGFRQNWPMHLVIVLQSICSHSLAAS